MITLDKIPSKTRNLQKYLEFAGHCLQNMNWIICLVFIKLPNNLINLLNKFYEIDFWEKSYPTGRNRLQIYFKANTKLNLRFGD